MSFLLDKSEENKTAFVQLNGQGLLTAPLFHLGYYSCYQKITHILMTEYKDEYEELSQITRGGGKGNNHGRVIDLFARKILQKIDKLKAQELKTKLTNLKSYRIEADYENKPIDKSKITKVEDYLNEFHRLAKRHYSI